VISVEGIIGNCFTEVAEILPEANGQKTEKSVNGDEPTFSHLYMTTCCRTGKWRPDWKLTH